jgi:hypothetical protein
MKITSQAVESAKWPATAAKFTCIASCTYLAILILLHIIKPEVTPAWQTLSIYSRGAWGWVGQINYCLLGITLFGMFATLKGQVKGRSSKIGLVILLIAAIGGIMGGLGISDPLNTPQADMTSSGQLHAIGAGLEIWGAPIAALLLNLNLLRKNSNWKSARKALIVVTILPILGLILFMASGASAGGHVGPGDIIGYMNRVAVVATIIWEITLMRIILKK